MKDGYVNLSKIPVGSAEVVYLDSSEEWFNRLLVELNEEFSKEEQQEIEIYIRFKGDLERKKSSNYGDYALLVGELSVRLCAYCGKTGALMPDDVECEVRAVCIPEECKKQFDLEDEISLFIDDDEYDLYYHNNLKLDVGHILREYAFLNRNPYPVSE